MKNKILLGVAILAIISVGSIQANETMMEPTIVDTAIQVNDATGEFSILIAALQAADPSVIETLSGKGQYTVFAPTDEAFTNLLSELEITAEEPLSNQALVTQVLLYHVAHGRLYAEDVLEKQKINTLLKGKEGFLYQYEGILTDNYERTSTIIGIDIETSNGIIHVIDTVVLP